MQKPLIIKTRLPVHNKLIWLSLFLVGGIIAFLVFFYLSFSSSLKQEKKAMSRYLSEAGIGVIEHFYKLASSGDMTSANAQKLAMNALKSASYGENGYFWINSGEGILLMQPYTPEKVGVNQIDWKDINGTYIFREFVEEAKNGGGWVSYSWPKSDNEKAYPKISYVAYFEPWNWVLGTGVYLDDMQKNVNRAVFQASGILLVCFIAFIIVAILIVNYFVNQLGKLAIRDPLTNLYTRRFLKEILPSVLAKHQRYKDYLLAVIFIDIDHFKKVNDTYGHDLGDEVLKQLAEVMVENLRSDDFCIRYGGEEFVHLGFYDDEPSVIAATQRIRNLVSQLIFNKNNVEFKITLSAGIAIYNKDEESFEETLKRADEKLYQSKEEGRNRVSI